MPEYNINDLLIYQTFKRVGVASKNVRINILLIAFACIISGASLWNSTSNNWLDSRLEKQRKYIYYFQQLESNKLNHADSTFDKKDYRKSKAYLNNTKYTDEGILRSYYDALATTRCENTLDINIPILGVVVDVNDLGILSGITLSILMFMLIYNLILKKNYLKKILTIIKNGKHLDKDVASDLITMNQTLTLFDSEKDKRIFFNSKRILRRIPDLLVVIPSVIQLNIIIHDLLTIKAGLELNMVSTIAVLLGSVFFYVVLLILTVAYFIQAGIISQLFKLNFKHK